MRAAYFAPSENSFATRIPRTGFPDALCFAIQPRYRATCPMAESLASPTLISMTTKPPRLSLAKRSMMPTSVLDCR